jgi:hypothetical protein
MKFLGYSLAVFGALAACAPTANAQSYTGDVLRGEGRYLEGAGWYNFNTARADRINVETWKSYNREVERLYRNYMIERAKEIRYKRGLTKKVQDQHLKDVEADMRRWRENPSAEDISSGNALNIIAMDLSDSSIPPSVWSRSSIELPPGVALTSMAFKIANTKAAYQRATVAIDRMLIKDDWPLEFRRPEIARHRKNYQSAISLVLEKCRKGDQLQAKDYEDLKATVESLKEGVNEHVPFQDSQRTRALNYVKAIEEAIGIFMGYPFAERLIRDVTTHNATDIATLLSFMRDYQLLFADPGDNPDVVSLYNNLYGLLRKQKEVLGIQDPKPMPETARQREPAANNGPFVVSTLKKHDHDPRTKKVRTGTVRLFSNGHINGPNAPATWTIQRGMIVMHWPNKSAPGGAWVDSMKIAADARSAKGRNQAGATIAVEVIDGADLRK